MKHLKNVWYIFIVLLAAPLSGTFSKDVIIFSTPPTQPPKVTMHRYGPVAKYLSRVTGKKVKLVPARNFIEYSQNLLDNKYDLLFDGPQFIGWRLTRFNHVVLAKLPRRLNFIIVVREDAGVDTVKKLAGKRVCGIGSPNLMTLGMIDLFPNPASVPVIEAVGGFKGALLCAQKGRGIAAVVRDKFWFSRKPHLKKGLKVLFHSKLNWPDRGFSISRKVDIGTRESIRRALLSQQSKEGGYRIFKRYRTPGFVSATFEEYKDLGKLLKQIWGFHDQ